MISVPGSPRIRLTASLSVMPLDRSTVQSNDDVPGLDSGTLRGGVGDGSDHLDEAVLHVDLDAEPAKLAGQRGRSATCHR